MEMKTCSRCGETNEATTEFFYHRNTCKDGLSGVCKTCIKIAAKVWHGANPEKVRAINKKWSAANAEQVKATVKAWHGANSKKVRATSKAWNEANPEKGKATDQAYRAANPEKVKAAGEAWRIANPEKHRRTEQRRRAKKRSLLSTLTLEQWEKIKIHFGGKCCYCGQGKPLTQDHFLALSKSGEYSHFNITPACSSCNSSKGNKEFRIWYPKQPFYCKKREATILKFLNYKNGIQQLVLM